MTISEELLESNQKFITGAEAFPEELRRERPKDGAFSATEIVYHMVAVEKLWEQRFDALLSEGPHTFVAMNPDAVALEENHNTSDYAAGVARFRSLRHLTAERVANFDDATLQLKGTHPKYGDLSILSILEIIRKHDLQHLSQLERTRDLLRQQETAA